MIPWDKDVDLDVFTTDMAVVERVIARMPPGMGGTGEWGYNIDGDGSCPAIASLQAGRNASLAEQSNGQE